MIIFSGQGQIPLPHLFGTKRTPDGRHSGYEDKQEQCLFPSHDQEDTGMVAEGKT